MYISQVMVENYKSFSHFTVPLTKGLSVIVGENNVGKSNMLEAMSLIFISNYSWKKRQLSQGDFYNELVIHDNWPQIKVEVTISDITLEDEMALCCKWLTREPGQAKITYVFRPKGNIKAELPKTPQSITGSTFKLPVDQYEWVIFGGEQETNDVFDHQMLSKFTLEYVGALRDATAELKKSSGRLHKLIHSFDQDETNKSEVLERLELLNQQIKKSGQINKTEQTINNQLRLVSGSQYQNTKIVMSENTYEDLLKDLKVLIGPANGKVHSVESNGLGYNNLLYISLLLGQYFVEKGKKHQEYLFPILTVEEPEAHLHSLLQKYLGGYFFNKDIAGQVIVTSHSTHISSTADLDSLTVMYRDGNEIKAKQIGGIFAKQDVAEKRHLERWLDATKSNIFFGRKTLLVEGMAERLLVPKFAELYLNESRKDMEPLLTLDGQGISIISVDGVAFRPFLKLFDTGALNMKCAVLTDRDPEKVPSDHAVGEPTKVDVYPTKVDEFPPCSRTANLINDYNGAPNIEIFTNLKTFEYDLIVEDNMGFFKSLIEKNKLGSATDRGNITKLSDPIAFAREAYTMISGSKGEVAQLILDEVQLGTKINVPRYIIQAIDYLMED
jgi:putative ATP-dependent endonuclease of OLD family